MTKLWKCFFGLGMYSRHGSVATKVIFSRCRRSTIPFSLSLRESKAGITVFSKVWAMLHPDPNPTLTWKEYWRLAKSEISLPITVLAVILSLFHIWLIPLLSWWYDESNSHSIATYFLATFREGTDITIMERLKVLIGIPLVAFPLLWGALHLSLCWSIHWYLWARLWLKLRKWFLSWRPSLAGQKPKHGNKKREVIYNRRFLSSCSSPKDTATFSFVSMKRQQYWSPIGTITRFRNNRTSSN